MRRVRVWMVAWLVLALLVLLPLSDSVAGADLKTVDTAQLHSMIVDNAYRLEGGRERQFMVIDARTIREYDEAHIFSAISIPETSFERSAEFLPKDKDTLIVVYCNDAKCRESGKWAEKAASAGYTNLAVYGDGFLTWKEKKMPVAPLRTGR